MSHVLSGLISKRAELGGELINLQKRLIELDSSIKALDSVILIFDPNYKSQSIRAKRVIKKNHWFNHGEASRLTLEAVGAVKGTWISTPEVADYIIIKKDITLTSDERDKLSSSITMALLRHASKGVIERSPAKGPHGEHSWLLRV